MMRGRRLSAPLISLVAVALLSSSCSYLESLDPTVKTSCSVVGKDRFDLEYAAGPELSPSEFLETPQGRTLEAFFNGGPGEVEGEGYLEADGFSIVSGRYVLGYRHGTPISDFNLSGDDVQSWGGCNPVLVRGNQVARRWYPSVAPEPEATTIRITVEGDACVESTGTRNTTEIVEIVVQDEDAVVITAWTREVNMPSSCAGVGTAIEAEAELVDPLGHRELLDGGLVPPRPPTR